MSLYIILTLLAVLLVGQYLFALSADRDVNHYVDQELRALPVAAAATIYQGALLGLSGGYVRPLVAGDAFAGIAYESIDNSSGSAGDLTVRAYIEGDFEHALSSASVTNNGRELYASDDATLTTSAAGNSLVGQQVEATTSALAMVRIRSALAAGTPRLDVITKASAANVTIAVADLNRVIKVSGTTASNLNLPAAATAGAGSWATFIKTGASGALTIEPNSTELVDGAANNADMDAAADTITIVCDGTGWYITSSKIAS